MWPNPQFPTDLVTFTGEILDRKLHFCAVGMKQSQSLLTRLFLMHTSSTPENIGFLMFSGGSERVHWEQMG